MSETMNARWLRWCLTAIVVLLALIALQLSALVRNGDGQAMAQDDTSTSFPNTTRQRLELLDEQRRTTEELRRILTHLKSGTIKVQSVSTDKENTSGGGKKTPTAPAPRNGRTGE